MKKNKNEFGFGTIEILLTIIVVILVVFVGWYIYYKSNKISTTVSSVTNTPVLKTAKPTNETSQYAATRAVAIATALLSATEGSQTTQGVSAATYVNSNSNYFTPNFKLNVDKGTVLSIAGQEGVGCTNNFPGAFGFNKVTINGNSATVLLTYKTTSGKDVTSQYSQVPQLTLKYINGNWAISGYSCIKNPT